MLSPNQMQAVINIKNSNMLGRKLLSEPYQLFGQNLDRRSLNMDNNLRYMKDRWFIEEIINDDTVPNGYLLKFFNDEERKRLNSKLNFNLSWNTSIIYGDTPGITSDFNIIPAYYVILEDNNILKIVNEINNEINNVIIRTSIRL